MKALICDLCGGSLRMNDDSSGAVCEYCGVRYTKSSLQSKIQEIKGTVSVEGISTKIDLFKKAETYKRLNEILKAEKTYRHITELYPEDPKGWWELFYIINTYDYVSKTKGWNWLLGESKTYAMNAIKLDSSYQEKYNNFVDTFINNYKKEIDIVKTTYNIPTISEMNRLLFLQEAESLKYLPKMHSLRKELLRDYESKVSQSDNMFLDIVKDKAGMPIDYKKVYDLLMEKGKQNAINIMEANQGSVNLDDLESEILGYKTIHEWSKPNDQVDLWEDLFSSSAHFTNIDNFKEFWKYNYPYFRKYECKVVFQLANVIYVRSIYYEEGNTYYMKYIIITKKDYTVDEINKVSRNGKIKKWKMKGCCQYCGGNFKKILFKTKCEKCKKEKDY